MYFVTSWCNFGLITLRTCLTLRSDYVRIPLCVRQTTDETTPLLFDNSVGTSREVAKVRYLHVGCMFNLTTKEILEENTSYSNFLLFIVFCAGTLSWRKSSRLVRNYVYLDIKVKYTTQVVNLWLKICKLKYMLVLQQKVKMGVILLSLSVLWWKVTKNL